MGNRYICLVLIFVLLPHVLYSQPDPVVQSIIEQTNIDSLTQFVDELSGEVQVIVGGSAILINSRHKNQSGNNKAADYIKQKLEYFGLPVYDQNFSATGRNVYAIQTGSTYPTQKYIICAHYDNMPSTIPAPGADDNASGTAAVLEAARILKNFQNEYTIIYAFWDEEEQGLVGSDYFAHNASAIAENILGVINLDMLAWENNGDDKINIHVRNIINSVTLSNKMVDVNTTYGIGLNSLIVNPGTTASDHSSFWNHNYSAILLIEDYYNDADGRDFNVYYHSANDKIQYFNSQYFLKCSKLAIGTLASLAEMENPLPVELSQFNIFKYTDNIFLKWKTSTEINSFGFEVEKYIMKVQNSIAKKKWEKIGLINAAGYSNTIKEYSFMDYNVSSSGVYYYRLKMIDNDGSYRYSKVVDVKIIHPDDYVLFQNFPNPFNSQTIINYQIPETGFIQLKIFDILGNEIISLVNDLKLPGKYSVTFNGTDFPAGIYYYNLKTSRYSDSKKIVLLK